MSVAAALFPTMATIAPMPMPMPLPIPMPIQIQMPICPLLRQSLLLTFMFGHISWNQHIWYNSLAELEGLLQIVIPD